VFNASLDELLPVVLGLVQTDNKWNSHLFKNWDVIVWSKRAVSIRLVQRPTERDKLAWKSPVEISVFHLLIVLVLLHVEGLVVVPSKCHCVLKSCKTMINSALVGASSHCRVTERKELGVVWSENLPSIQITFSKDNYHVAAHQEGSVSLLSVVNWGVVVNLKLGVAWIEHQLFKLFAKLVHLAQIQRTKVSEEWLVYQIIVNAKVKRMLARLGRVLVTDPVQSARNNFNWLV